MSDSEWGYKLAVHMSCPLAKYISLTHEKGDDGGTPGEIFPASLWWNAIVRQYARSPVEEVALEMRIPLDSTTKCSLIFQSSDTTVLRLHF